MEKKAKKSIIVSDLDLTLTSESLLNTLVDYQQDRGMLSSDVRKARTAVRARYDRGEIDYRDGSRLALQLWSEALAGMDYEELVQDTARFLSEKKNIFYPYFEEALKEFSDTHDFYLVTANLQFVPEAVSRVFNIDGFASTRMDASGGVCGGKLGIFLGDSDAKAQAVDSLLNGYIWDHSVALGDTENDIGMLAKVAHPFCVDANVHLAKAAERNNWPVVRHEDIMVEIRRHLGKI